MLHNLSMWCCRPASADGDSGLPGSQAAGLYWRKHRLLVPEGYTMTEEQAQAAVGPVQAQHQDAESAADHMASDSIVVQPDADSQQQPDQSCGVQHPPDQQPHHLDPEMYSGEVSPAAQEVPAEVDSKSADMLKPEILIIEDAAELTSDRAALILRQLSFECQTAEGYASCSGNLCQASQSAASPHHPDDAPQQPLVTCQSVPQGANATLPEARNAAGMEEMLEPPPAQAQDSVSALLNRGKPVECSGTSEHAAHADCKLDSLDTAGSGLLASASKPNSVPKAGVSEAPAQAMAELASVSSAAASTSGRDVGQCEVEVALSSPACSVGEAESKQAVAGSAFLQRLQMSKHVAIRGSEEAALQGHIDTEQGEHAVSAEPSRKVQVASSQHVHAW